MSPVPAFDPLGLPAPAWLLFGLKVFGFWLHVFFMNLWFAGLLVGLVLARREGPLAEAGQRLLRGMPIFIALGINAGIVPLLFLQVLFPQFFYTSTILQAWAWFAIIPLLVVAYYGVYVYVLGMKAGRTERWVAGAGWAAAAVFLVIGLLFSTEMRFMTQPHDWLYHVEPNVGGAVTGTGLGLSGIAVLRYLMMFGFALATTGAYLALDAEVFRGTAAAREGGLPRLVFALVVAGLVVFGGASLLYLPSIQAHLEGSPLLWLAGAGPVLPLLGGGLYLLRPGKGSAVLLLGFQAVSLLLNAITRQVVQVREIAPAFDLDSVAVNTQLSPIILFLASLVLGLGVVAWLVTTFVRAARARPA